ncbi:MAG TPA: hypothetical protein VG605_23215 [Puia sp.]|nr:hypothetical protein [Puia sp.]
MASFTYVYPREEKSVEMQCSQTMILAFSMELDKRNERHMQLIKLTNNIFTIDGFWTQQECEHFIKASEDVGYQPATIDTEKGQIIFEAVRNNNRVLYEDLNLAEKLWQQLKQYAPEKIGNSIAIGLKRTVSIL